MPTTQYRRGQAEAAERIESRSQNSGNAMKTGRYQLKTGRPISQRRVCAIGIVRFKFCLPVICIGENIIMK
eukprot:scaffold577717_cov20-Prasinocladus_malaysianus.AAC.1